MFSTINSCINSNCNRKRMHYLRICTLIGHSVIQIIGVANSFFFFQCFFSALLLCLSIIDFVFLTALFIKIFPVMGSLIGEYSIGHDILLLYYMLIMQLG